MTEHIELTDILILQGRNCRSHILPDDVRDLAQSIKEHGLLSPVVVQPSSRTATNGEPYRLVAGYRRYMDVQSLGWREIPAIVRDVSHDEADAICLIENLDRKDLNCLEEAIAVERQFPRGRFSLRETARSLRKHPTWCQARRDLLQLPDATRKLFADGSLKLSQLDFIKRAPDVVQAAIDAAEKRAREPKPKPEPKRRRTRREISKRITDLIDAGHQGPVTIAMAWCAGYVDDATLDAEIEAG